MVEMLLSFIDPRKYEWESFAHMTQYDFESRMTVKNSGYHEAKRVSDGFCRETPRRTREKVVILVNSLLIWRRCPRIKVDWYVEFDYLLQKRLIDWIVKIDHIIYTAVVGVTTYEAPYSSKGRYASF